MKKKLAVGQDVKLDDGRLDDGHEIWIGKVVKVKFFGGVDVLINAEYGKGQIMHFDRNGKEIGVDPWSLYPAWQIVDTDINQQLETAMNGLDLSGTPDIDIFPRFDHGVEIDRSSQAVPQRDADVPKI